MGRLHTVLAGALVVVQEEQEVVGALVVLGTSRTRSSRLQARRKWAFVTTRAVSL